ncbi:cytokine receptor-like factor 3 [Lycorma delicatula]|uniref:cytokine receptor-like factor 3 n=1 Tax=Lycorma delicatula TaxID=130591 RepID=UPI003F517B5F
MEEFCRKTLSETVDTATEYSSKLEELTASIIKAQQQVKVTAEESLMEIENVFDELTMVILAAIEKRRSHLKKKVKKIEEKGLAPLNACHEVIINKLKLTQNYICEGQHILDQLHKRVDVTNTSNYLDQASFLGCLPAVPNLDEVPAVTFQCNVDSIKNSIIERISDAGTVSCIGPIQLTNVQEKPGGLFVHWEEVEVERPVDIQSFRLQIAVGDYPDANQNHTNAKYRDIYEGMDSAYLVRDLKTNQPYTFRVCCQESGSKCWSAWSLPKVATTHIPPFVWDCSNPHYSTSVEGKIACKTTNNKSVLFSSLPLIGSSHSIEFMVLECGKTPEWGDGIGLSNTNADLFDLIQPGVLFLNAQGHIFLDGKEKTTRLPPLKKGCRVSFTCEELPHQNRLRINIDSEDKAVTYDWKTSSKLHFVMNFTYPGWKLLVE